MKNILKNIVEDATIMEKIAENKIFLFFLASFAIDIVTATEETIPPKIPERIIPFFGPKIFIKM